MKFREIAACIAPASHFMGECFDLSVHMLDREYTGLHPFVRFVLAQLYFSCHATSESALLLLEQGKEWDAEILNRSIMEGFAKFAYITNTPGDEALKRAEEYWILLPTMQDVSHHIRIKNAIEVIKDRSPALEDVLLPPNIFDELKVKMPKADRKALNQKWSFMELSKFLSSQNDVILKCFKGLEHGYGMGSHLMHKDGTGVGIIWDRARRDEVRKNAVIIGHTARIISDLCVWAQMNSVFLRKACGEETVPLSQLREKYEFLFKILEKASSDFNEAEYG